MGKTPILPAPCLVAPVMWELDADIEQALHTESAPLRCPVGRQYVPSAVRDQLIYWAHTSPSSGHPRIGRTVRCLSGKYWWPTLAKDVRVYVSSCSVCAQCKVPRHLPRGKLHPLPVPQRPWSHLSVDSLTDLPPTILVIVDLFSKSCHLLPLPGLPMAPRDRVWQSTRNLPTSWFTLSTCPLLSGETGQREETTGLREPIHNDQDCGVSL